MKQKQPDHLLDNPIIKRMLRPLITNIKVIIRQFKKNKSIKHATDLTKTSLRSAWDNLPDLFANSLVQIVSIIVIAIMLSLSCIFFQVGNRFDRSLYIINIPKGYGARQVAEMLESKGIIEGRYGFNIIINMFGLQNRMLAGTYEFSPNMSLIKIIWKIKNGEIIPPMLVKLILPEGISIYKMSRVMILEGIGDGLEFQKLTDISKNSNLFKKYLFLSDIPTDSLEGYLFPDTYLVPSNIGTNQLADIMLSRFNKIVMPYWKKNKKKMKVKMTLHEVLTLASIIEKEAAVDNERAMISSVYHNRLRIRMHLGADPTIKYVLERPGKIVSYDDLKIESPYNTYRHYGLPPGPICSPGIRSVQAAMFPASSDYLYFVARADGSHIFTKSLTEHQSAQELTRKDRIRKIYKRNVNY